MIDASCCNGNGRAAATIIDSPCTDPIPLGQTTTLSWSTSTDLAIDPICLHTAASIAILRFLAIPSMDDVQWGSTSSKYKCLYICYCFPLMHGCLLQQQQIQSELIKSNPQQPVRTLPIQLILLSPRLEEESWQPFWFCAAWRVHDGHSSCSNDPCRPKKLSRSQVQEYRLL